MKKSIIVDNISKKFIINHEGKHGSNEQRVASSFLSRFSRSKIKHSSNETFWALKNICFEVDKGERLAIVGRNGAGKSTLLKILSRVMSPTSGSIQVRGRLSSLLEVGTGFHPELTGRENVYLNGAVLGMTRAEVISKFDAIVDFSGVERFLDTPVKRYSSGMYVRLAFAVSAFLEPDIIVLDEVMSVGDAEFQHKSYAKMRELASQGRTVIFVSHSMSAVKELCDSAIVIENGTVKEKTKVDEAIGDYMRHVMHVHGTNMPLETEQVDLLTMKLTQDGRQTSNHQFDGGKPIDLEIIYEVKERLSNFRIGFYIKSYFGEVITRSLIADWKPPMEEVKPSTYRLTGSIPSNFLVSGNYVFEIHCSEFGIRDFFGENALQPFVVMQPLLFNLQHSQEQPFGFVYLDPEWSMEQLSD